MKKQSDRPISYSCFLPIAVVGKTYKNEIKIDNGCEIFLATETITIHLPFGGYLYDIHWPPVNLRIRFKVLLFVFKAIHGVAPSHISDLILVKPNSSYNLRLSSAGILLAFPSRKTKTLGDRSCSVAALWNKIPRELVLRDLEDFNSFKQKLKTHIFIEGYS